MRRGLTAIGLVLAVLAPAAIDAPGAAAAGRAVGVAPAATGSWTVDAAGQVTGVGGARSLGSVSGALRHPIVGMASTPSRDGYWLVASDGGIFTFGDATFLGSTGAIRLAEPIVGMAPTPTGRGYWLVARDGGIFTFGDAVFRGSTGAMRLVQPIIGMARTKTGGGYWLVAGDGGVFTFGDAAYAGRSLGATAVTAAGGGYRVATADGTVASFVAGAVPSVARPPVLREAWKWPFASTSPWNMPIGSGAQFAATSDPRTASLLDGRSSPWVNAGTYSHPIYRARSTDPMATFRRSGHDDVTYRVPLDARAADGGDQHLHVVDPAGRYVDESWNTEGSHPSFTTGHHVRTDLYGPGVGEGGVRAYGGSAIGGLIRQWELDAGSIRHALALAVDGFQLRRGPVWPATTEDGNASSSYSGNLPMGSLVAIPGSVDVNRLGLTSSGLVVARALQDYGAYVVDRSGAFTFYAEPSTEGSAALRELRRDVAALRAQLRVVTNNGPGSVGGGGIPRAPLAPSL